MVSPRLQALDFSDDIKRLTEDFVGREWIFREIDEWVSRPGESFFILTGEAGIGKSAITARLTQVRGDIAAYHFCIAGRNSTIVPGTVLRSIAAQFGKNLDGYGDALANTIKPTYVSVDVKIHIGTMNGGQITGVVLENLTLADPKQELESLLTAPLSAMPALARPVLIMLDSLDEAFTYDSSVNLVTLLAGLNDLPSWVRIVLTSRPEERALSYFASVPKHVVTAESQLNRNDLRRYVIYRVGKRTLRVRLRAAPMSVKPRALADQVTGIKDNKGLADGNFLYTKILLNDVESGAQPLDDLAALPKSLDEIYQRFLLRLAPEWETKYQPLLTVLAVAREPLTREHLLQFGDQSARLIGGRMSATLVNLALGVLVQFLDVRGAPGSEQYSLFHQSLRDYLGETSHSGRFACPPKDGHGAIADYHWQATFDQAAGRHNWQTCDEYGLANLAFHLAEAGRHEDLRTLLLDFGWYRCKLEVVGLDALVNDCDLLREELEMRVLSGALGLSWRALHQDPRQLAGQLLARLMDYELVGIKHLLDDALLHAERPCLIPVAASLTPPGLLLGILSGHKAVVQALAMTADGKTLVSGSRDGEFRIWDLESRGSKQTMMLPAGTRLLAFDQEAKRGVVLTPNNRLEVWDLAEQHLLLDLTRAQDRLPTAIDATGDLAAWVTNKDTIEIWNVNTRSQLPCLLAHPHPVTALAFSPGRKLLLSAAGPEVGEWIPWGHFEHHGEVISPDDAASYALPLNNALTLWDIKSCKPLVELPVHAREITAVALSNDGQIALTASRDNTLRLWNLEEKREIGRLANYAGVVSAVALASNAKVAVTASEDYTIKLWDISGKTMLSTNHGHVKCANSVAVSPDGKWALSGGDDYRVRMWDLTTGKEIDVFHGHQDWVRIIVISLNGQRAVSGGHDDCRLCVWDISTRSLLHSFFCGEPINDLALSADGRFCVSADDDYRLRLWDIVEGKECRPPAKLDGQVRSVAITADARIAVAGTANGTLWIWDFDRDEPTLRKSAHSSWIKKVAVTSDGATVITGGGDGGLLIWDLTTGSLRFELLKHGAPIHDLILARDGRKVIAGLSDGTLGMWDVDTGARLALLDAHEGSVNALAVAADDHSLISASSDGKLMIWDLDGPNRLAVFRADDTLTCCATDRRGSVIVAGDMTGRVHILRFETSSRLKPQN